MSVNNPSRILLLAVAICLSIVTVGRADELALPQLAAHPEFWPDKVTLKKDLQFGGGKTLHAGQQFDVVEVRGEGVGVADANGDMFLIESADCDLLQVANADYAKLTPEQRALSIETLLKDPTLIPPTVHSKSKAVFDMPRGGSITLTPEQDLRIVSLEPSMVVVEATGGPAVGPFNFTPGSTTLIRDARERLAKPEAERSGRIVEALRGNTVDKDGKPIDVTDADYFVIYIARKACGNCAVVTPALVKRIAEKYPANKKLAFVFVQADGDPVEALAYASEQKAPFAVVNAKATAYLRMFCPQVLPGVTVVDRFGRVIETNKGRTGDAIQLAMTTLDRIDQRVDAGEIPVK